MTRCTGGYDDGYLSCSCFWGRSPGSLVTNHLQQIGTAKGLKVLDLGCGEGKNANAYAEAGAHVTAVDCSIHAIENGLRAFSTADIDWIQSDAHSYLREADLFDVIIMYGLLHCLSSETEVVTLIDRALNKTRKGGTHIIAVFNNGPHDLSAHPGFKPLLLPHEFYVACYSDCQITSAVSSILKETHPHNEIEHFHSLTRLIALK
jgi:tellurite methyltransferase